MRSEVIGVDHDGNPLSLMVCPMWYLAFSLLFGALCAGIDFYRKALFLIRLFSRKNWEKKSKKVFVYYVIIARNFFMHHIMMKPEGWVSLIKKRSTSKRISVQIDHADNSLLSLYIGSNDVGASKARLVNCLNRIN